MRLPEAVALALMLAAGAACAKEKTRAAAVDAGIEAATVPPGPTVLSAEEGRALVKGACLSCHSEEMLAQQRLTEAQWTKTVTKMVGWGANLEPRDTAPLTAWLAATYGPDAGPHAAAPIDVDAAEAELTALPDGPFAGGDPERGRTTYTDKCSGCHGPEARGHIGTILVDRPFLYRAQGFAETVRRGRGKMPPLAMSDADLADVLAHLRRLK
jgi:mono/diheme cytochrome c family protein